MLVYDLSTPCISSFKLSNALAIICYRVASTVRSWMLLIIHLLWGLLGISTIVQHRKLLLLLLLLLILWILLYHELLLRHLLSLVLNILIAIILRSLIALILRLRILILWLWLLLFHDLENYL